MWRDTFLYPTGQALQSSSGKPVGHTGVVSLCNKFSSWISRAVLQLMLLSRLCSLLERTGSPGLGSCSWGRGSFLGKNVLLARDAGFSGAFLLLAAIALLQYCLWLSCCCDVSFSLHCLRHDSSKRLCSPEKWKYCGCTECVMYLCTRAQS